MKIILKRELPPYSCSYLTTLDLDKYNNKLQRFELKQSSYERIVNVINQELKKNGFTHQISTNWDS